MTDAGREVFTPRAVPKLVRYLSWTVLAACVVMTFVGGWRLGVTEDEPYHVQRFNNYLHTGWYLADGQLDHGRPSAEMTQQYVYGPVAMLVLHGVNAAVGVEPWGHAGVSAHAYAVRHLTVGAFGLLGLLAVVLTGRVLFRRWDWGVVAGAVIAAVPLWTGHAMFNVKDVPVGTGYAWATLGLVLLARERETARWWVRWGGPVVLAGGAVLAVGTRPAMWSGIAFGAVVLVGCRLLRPQPARLRERARADVWVLRDLAVVTVVTWLALWLLDPKVFGSPATALVRSVHSSAEFLDITAPFLAVPIWVAMQIPLLIVGFALVGAYVVVRRTIATGFRPPVVETRWLLIGVQAFAMPVGVMVTKSPVYGDLRQLLFSAPAAALLATLGMHRLLLGAGSVKDRTVGTMARAIVAAALVVPVAMQAMLFPYNYTFYNPLAAVAGLVTNGDYYRASARELVAEVPLTGRFVCSPETDDDKRATREAHLNGWMDCRSDVTAPVSPFRDSFAGSTSEIGADEFWAMTFQSNRKVPPNCERVTGYSRRTLWQHLNMATLSRCRLPFPTLPDRLVEFREKIDIAMRLPDLGWLVPSLDQTAIGLRAHGGRSTMVFRLPESARGKPATLVLRTADPASPEVSFGGVPLTPQALSSGPGFTLSLPAALVDRAVEQAQTLEFRAAPPGDLELEVMSIELQTG